MCATDVASSYPTPFSCFLLHYVFFSKREHPMLGAVLAAARQRAFAPHESVQAFGQTRRVCGRRTRCVLRSPFCLRWSFLFRLSLPSQFLRTPVFRFGQHTTGTVMFLREAIVCCRVDRGCRKRIYKLAREPLRAGVVVPRAPPCALRTASTRHLLLLPTLPPAPRRPLRLLGRRRVGTHS
jgi:hypothetical protein